MVSRVIIQSLTCHQHLGKTLFRLNPLPADYDYCRF